MCANGTHKSTLLSILVSALSSQHYTAVCRTAVSRTAMSRTAVYRTDVCPTAVHHITLHCIALHYTVNSIRLERFHDTL